MARLTTFTRTAATGCHGGLIIFGLIPKDEKFFEMFNQLADEVVKGAELLKEMVDHYDDPVKSQKKIKEVEHAADAIYHDIIKKLNASFITPFDREDIYALANGLDDILDMIDASAQRFVMFHVEKPTAPAKELVFLILKCCQTIQKTVVILNGKVDPISAFCKEVKSLENEADRVWREAISHLFDSEIDPITLIKWKEIYETLEKATDKCEDAANILESVVVKNA
jgi:predicted phosphate transport protein (TIGR00153 family)